MDREPISYSTPTGDMFFDAAQRVDGLVQELTNLPYPVINEKVVDLLQNVDTLHRTALERLVTLIRASGHGDAIERAAADDVVRSLLTLYDLVPVDEKTLAGTALSDIQSRLRSYGGNVEVLAASDGTVDLRLTGPCAGCEKSREALCDGIEAALREGYPGFKEARFEDATNE